MVKKLLDLKETQEVLGVGRNTLLSLLHEKDFPSFKLKSKWYVNVDKLQHWIDKQTENKEVF